MNKLPTNYYHIYNRGAHKAKCFIDAVDYRRFLNLLYLANDTKPVRISDLNPSKIYEQKRNDTLVEIIAYCLMPNHFHILLREKTECSKTKFIQKLCTGYSMYYNKKYSHSGIIFQGSYKFKLVNTDDYFRYLIQYIHLNPFGIEEPELMKTAKLRYLQKAIKYSKKYEYSSYKDYCGVHRAQSVILTVRSDLTVTKTT